MSMPRKILCEVERVIDHGGRVYSLHLIPSAPVPSFQPGQFAHLTVDEYDQSGFWPESRVFSIASSPASRKRIVICYSVKGRYTEKMERTLKAGAQVWLKLPYGDFVIDPQQDAVLLAGGTGISAFTAFIEALGTDSLQQTYLFYGVRRASLILFKDMLLHKAAEVPHLHLFLSVEEPSEDFAATLAGLPGNPVALLGRLSVRMVWDRITKPQSKIYYLSGPPEMLKTLGHDLAEQGVQSGAIRTDAWE